MSVRLDLPRLHALCGAELPAEGGNTAAGHVVVALGPLAPLWLEPEVLDRAHAWRCEMTGEPCTPRPRAARLLERGQIGILLATQHAPPLPLLRPAFVLPVTWQRGSDFSPRLPAGLAAFAAKVLRDIEINGLSLHLPAWLENSTADFSALEFSPCSAWAALAAGAIVARQGSVTRPDVLVSAAWTPESPSRGWIAPVDGVDAKLDAALAAGAGIVLLPQENALEAAAWRARHPDATIEIRHLSNVPGEPQRVLAPVLHALEAAPSRAADASFATCSDYFVRMPEEGHNEYYRDELVADVAAQLRRQVEGDDRLRGVNRLVIIASKSWSLGILLASLFDPGEVLVLHDGGLDASLQTLLQTLPAHGRAGRPPRVVRAARCRPGVTFADDVAAALAAFAAPGGGGRIAIDLTAGYRDFHFAVLSALPPNAEVVFVHAPQDRRHARVKPGTEQLRRLAIPGR